MFLYTGQAFKQAPQRIQYKLSLAFSFARMFVRPLSNKMTYMSSGPSVSPVCLGPVTTVLYTVIFWPVPYVANKGQNKPRSVSEGIIFSMQVTTMCVLGHEQL